MIFALIIDAEFVITVQYSALYPYHFEYALCETFNGLVPVPLGVLGEGAEDVGQEDVRSALGQHIHAEVLRVPVVQCALSDLR